MNGFFEAVVGAWLFVLGSVVGSFLNVCIYRIPWQKSVIWPGSHCPKCLLPIAARDNIPILSWLLLRGECRRCAAPIAARYAMIELLVALLFVGAYLTDVIFNPMNLFGNVAYARMAYHQLLLALLVAATFIDYDLQIIPDEVTVTGMVLGILFGALIPDIRTDPASAGNWWDGLKMGVIGWAVGGGLPWSFRIVFSKVFRREALGFGDVTLMAMVGAFLGWQAAVLAFFLAPFFGFAHAGWKLLRWMRKLLLGLKSSSRDRELAFGPYLSMASVALLFSWPWLWKGWGREFFDTLRVVFWFLLGF
jgi:leader peptidase (prepilin peptidase)/N-methyltransferase